MNNDFLQNISHIYSGLIRNDRAFASFKPEEVVTIFSDLQRCPQISDTILDPMSGYGGTMSFFGQKGYKTVNIEINPPEYYWQLLINPKNTNKIIAHIDKIKNIKISLNFKEQFSITDNLFSEDAIKNIKIFYEKILKISENQETLTIALLLPFVSRFANYQKSKTNITHFKSGGFCSYINWENDFEEYLTEIKKKISLKLSDYNQIEHENILSDLMKFESDRKFSIFVTSPPYPNYRDYSKIFKIENWVLDNIIFDNPTDFNMMIGSNNVSKKPYGEILSEKANNFLAELEAKSNSDKLKPKSKTDIKTYYLPYFKQYFYNIQEAYKKLDSLMTENAVGYIVVNDNITRDIIVPVRNSICDIFNNLGYESRDIDTSQISHYGNIGKSAKRINSKHTRHIIKVWKGK